jgi:ABC-type Fe3+-hydroxamate transport system substrate-binding protein
MISSPTGRRRRPYARAAATLAACLAAATVLAACGDDDSGSADKPAAASSGPVSIVDHTGKTIALEAPATRVVSADWTSAEIALALGVTPVAVGDRDTYRNWVGAGEDLPASVAAIGARYEPSLEKIAALKPDLIVQESGELVKGRDKLEAIAPVAGLDAYALSKASPKTEWAAMRDATLKLGTLLGKDAEAKALLKSTDSEIAVQAQRIKDAGHAGDSVVLTQTSVGGKPATRLFDDGSEMVAVLRKLGLKNGFEGKHQDYSFTEVGLEGLRQVGDTDWLLTLAQKQDTKEELNAFGAWKDNPVFTKLPVVKAGRVHEIGGDNWTWGGPLSASRLATKIADVLAAPESS